MASPRPALRVPTVSRGVASICCLNYGSSPHTALIQERLRIGKALEGYDVTVLLMPAATPAWAELSTQDEQQATYRELPTRTNLFQSIIRLAEDGYCIDLFLFAHGWRERFGAYEGHLASEDQVSANDIEWELDPHQTGFTQLPIRVVWGSNSYGGTLAESWRAVGAKAVAGARFVNFYPGSWNCFIDYWNQGEVAFGSAITRAGCVSQQTRVQRFIALGDAPTFRRQHGLRDCPAGKTVLDNHPCAWDYFGSRWLAEDEWQPGLSGLENMAYASRMIRCGDLQLTKNTRPVWN